MSDSSYWSKQYKIRKLRAIEYKGGKCQRCGYDKCAGAFDFHHRDSSQKEFTWTKLRKRRWVDILKELDKCDLLCSTCHREEHHDEELWQEAIKWREKWDNSKIKPIKCPNCGDEFRPRERRIKHCSRACASEGSVRKRGQIKYNGTRDKVCETCKKPFRAKNTSIKHCSHACAREGCEAIEWPHNLPSLVKESSKLQVAVLLGVSDKAVAKRLTNHHGPIIGKRSEHQAKERCEQHQQQGNGTESQETQ